MLEKIESLRAEIENLSASTAQEVEALRIKYLSKKGEISVLMNDFRALSGDEKRTLGAPVDKLKDFANRKNRVFARIIGKQRGGCSGIRHDPFGVTDEIGYPAPAFYCQK